MDLHFQVIVRDSEVLFSAIPDAASVAPNLDAQSSASLQETLTALVEGFRPSVTKQFLCGLIPRTNLALVGYREGGISRAFEQIE
jgi:hypothetical protein